MKQTVDRIRLLEDIGADAWPAATTVWLDHRRRGVARGLLANLAAWAREQGANQLHLQVEADNTPARRLYAGLGFTEAYAYHYRRST